MKAKLLNHANGARTFAVIFDTGDEVSGGLLRFAKENRLSAAQLTGIGAFQDAVLGYFQMEKKDYKRIPVREQVELVSLIGDVALDENGVPKIHAHVVVTRQDGMALGGHLLEAHVRPTLEVIVTESPAHLQRRHDATSGLALIRL